MKCWASVLGDCDSISREHLVSKCLFKDSVQIQGYSWLPKGEIKTIGINSLVSNVLCKKHNSMTSDLDTASLDSWLLAREHSRLINLRRKIKSTHWKNVSFTIDGLLLERWCLKVMTNMFYSKSIKLIQGWVPPDDLVHIIFGSKPLSQEAGLGFFTTVGDKYRISDSISFNPVFSNQNPIGSIIDFRGIAVVVTWDFPVCKVPIPPQILPEKVGNDFPMRHLNKIMGSPVNVDLHFNWNKKMPPAQEKTLAKLRREYSNEN